MNFEAVLAGLPDAVVAVDAETRIVFWNAAAEELTGRSARRAEGRTLKELFAAERDGLLVAVEQPIGFLSQVLGFRAFGPRDLMLLFPLDTFLKALAGRRSFAHAKMGHSKE